MPDIKNANRWSNEEWIEAFTELAHKIQTLINERIETNEMLEKHEVFSTLLSRELPRDIMILLNLPENSIFDADRLVSLRLYRGSYSRESRRWNGPAVLVEGTYKTRSFFRPRHFKTRKDGTVNIEAAADYAIEIAEGEVRRAIGKYEAENEHRRWLTDLRNKTPLPWDDDGNLDLGHADVERPNISISPYVQWEENGFQVRISNLIVENTEKLLDLLDFLDSQIPLVGPDPREKK